MKCLLLVFFCFNSPHYTEVHRSSLSTGRRAECGGKEIWEQAAQFEHKHRLFERKLYKDWTWNQKVRLYNWKTTWIKGKQPYDNTSEWPRKHPGPSDRRDEQMTEQRGDSTWSRTLGDLYIQGGPDQSHEGGVKMHRVVVCDRQIHAQQPLWRASRDERMRRGCVLAKRAECLNLRGMGSGLGGFRGRGWESSIDNSQLEVDLDWSRFYLIFPETDSGWDKSDWASLW